MSNTSINSESYKKIGGYGPPAFYSPIGAPSYFGDYPIVQIAEHIQIDDITLIIQYYNTL